MGGNPFLIRSCGNSCQCIPCPKWRCLRQKRFQRIERVGEVLECAAEHFYRLLSFVFRLSQFKRSYFARLKHLKTVIDTNCSIPFVFARYQGDYHRYTNTRYEIRNTKYELMYICPPNSRHVGTSQPTE